jgi:hypothetical protein
VAVVEVLAIKIRLGLEVMAVAVERAIGHPVVWVLAVQD